MKYRSGIVWSMVLVFAGLSCPGQVKSGDQRMQQDLEVAENILGTLLRQESGRRGFFPVDVKGTYVPGYGVTLRMPVNRGFNSIVIAGAPEPPDMVEVSPGGMSYSWSRSETMEEKLAREEERASRIDQDRIRGRATVTGRTKRDESDSASIKAQQRFMDVAKSFLTDYGDVISGLKPDERIVITNRGDDFEGDFDMVWFNGKRARRQLMSVEARRGDIEQFRQGKISRTEFLNRLKTVSTESSDTLDPDLEVLASLFGRLYREDLSKTYYVQGNLNYERLKDFGVMYYMKVYSSMETDNERFTMPTLELRDVPQEERDKKVKELYPRFESDLKDNMVEYGRTLRSLGDKEQLVFNVRLTKCTGCGIPASLELSIPGSALKDYSSGKATKEATLARINVKKTGVQ